MRLVLIIAVVALLADVLINDSAFTRAAYRQVAIAADRLVDTIHDTVTPRGGSKRSD